MGAAHRQFQNIKIDALPKKNSQGLESGTGPPVGAGDLQKSSDKTGSLNQE
jgi:hypothetical protein